MPDDINAEDAAFLPTMETAVNFVMDGAPVIGEDVLVFGQGIVGLLTTSILAGFPLANLITLDQHALRRQTSREAGAGASLDPDDTALETLLHDQLPNGADLTYRSQAPRLLCSRRSLQRVSTVASSSAPGTGASVPPWT